MDFKLKYRPKDWADVIGQEHVLKSLRGKDTPKVTLLLGEAGLGKTTIARIMAKNVNCVAEPNLIEINASDKTGVDFMRELVDGVRYPAQSLNPNKFIILDEVHMLSKASWQMLLKVTEEPPEHVYFVFITTEAGKVPKTMKDQRATTFKLKPVHQEEIETLLTMVNDKENLDLYEDLDLIASAACGSPRKALNLLQKSIGCNTRKELKLVLETAEEDHQVNQLCKILIKGGSWDEASKVIMDITHMGGESIRIVIMNYMMKVLLSAKPIKKRLHIISIMELFSTELEQSTAMSEICMNTCKALDNLF